MEVSLNKIDADDRTIRNVLDKVKYTIDFFQREYRWERKHIEQLITDLVSRFLFNYEDFHVRKDVQNYSRYYLGPIVLCKVKDQPPSIIDGQQRLTSITLLLIYLNNLQKGREDSVPIKDLIFSEKYAEKSFNLQIDDRKECIEALYNGLDFDPAGKGESVSNIIERYHDIEELFPDELKERALPFFIDWLIDNVVLVQIVTYSDEDAYTIFETMNDRGLNLTSTEMLKGYILSKIDEEGKKREVNDIWRKNVYELDKLGKEQNLEFFKVWLRAKFAESIRPGKKGAENEDFEKIGTRFHSWVRDNRESIGLKNSDDFYRFVREDCSFYINLYLQIAEAEKNFTTGLENLYYIAKMEFTLRSPLLLASIKKTDDKEIVRKKLQLVARFIETFIVYRLLNYRTLAYSSIRYTMFTLVKEIRNKDVPELVSIFKSKIGSYSENLSAMSEFALQPRNRHFVHFLLARITSHVEGKSGMPVNFERYVDYDITHPYQVEHIWADVYDEHKDEFSQMSDFIYHRSRLGDFILLPSDFNQSYGALPYDKKLPYYYGQNILAKTLSPQCYSNNPGFLSYMSSSALPFKPCDHFKKADIIDRQTLYQKISEEIWDPKGFDEIANS